MRSRMIRLLAAAMLAVPVLGLAAPGNASAAPSEAVVAGPHWIYWNFYYDNAACHATGQQLAYPGSPIYLAYLCQQDFGGAPWELFLLKAF